MKRFGQWLGIAMVATMVLAFVSCAALCRKEGKIPVKDLPESVVKAVQAKFPAGKLEEAEVEIEDGKKMYEVEVEDGKNEYEVKLTADGTIVEVEKAIAAGALPKAVQAAVKKVCPKGVIKEAEEVTVGKEVTYEVEVKSDGKTLEIELAADGTVISKEVEDEDEADEDEADEDEADDDDDDDNDDDEQEVALKDLPKAVQDAVRKAFPKGKIAEAEVQTKGGKEVYEVDVMDGGKEWEVKLSADGKILEKELDD